MSRLRMFDIPLLCRVRPHRRSGSKATYDEKHGRWFSECRRCHIMLMREPDGRWVPAPPPPAKLVPIARPEQSEELAETPDSDPLTEASREPVAASVP